MIDSRNYFENKVNEYVIPNINQNIINNQLIKQLSEEVNELNKKNIDNYITLTVLINNNDIGKDIIFINQCNICDYNKNFEFNDIEIIIDKEIISLKYKNNKTSFEYNKESKNCEEAQKINYKLNKEFSFYWNFSTNGTHLIKIIFKKKLKSCKNMFFKCDNITEIDCSFFDCSEVSSCENMFSSCTYLKKINFGKLNFSLSKSFQEMFFDCENLIELDTSNFNTKNSLSFESMFNGCIQLKKLDVKNFDSSKCENMICMFKNCQNITEIDILKWDMSKLKKVFNKSPISELFFGCKKLKTIKMSANFRNIPEFYKNGFLFFVRNIDIFKGIPENGIFIWKKGVKCDLLLQNLPVSWNRIQEE